MEHMLVTYSAECAKDGHVDPNFTQLVYGNSGKNGESLKKHLKEGSYLFFNARIGSKRYITAYFYIEKVLVKNENDAEISALNCDAKDDNIVFIGSRQFSKVLTIPLELDKDLLLKLKSYEATEEYFETKNSELVAIKDKTLNPTVITEEEKELLISLCKDRG
ncbi:hypothetical protein [Clostridium tetanomorphum]|uniref:Uncharacterized protein n=1 Tax=Clostridium tetanomorphum TaxID=1553 RepID=A0A923EBK2_CLOTT|nr:hypothetical protein [Clostridium tetanomorphum]MBC2398734.1 hypothetical protein [Clostridium tetanomorphum]NRZ99307.1 hypothetical protein [Clostridium tetanomorphum]